MAEKRSMPRMRGRKSGTIAFGVAAIDCTARNVTVAGALLEVEGPLGIPQRFVRVIPADQVSRSCRPVWAAENGIMARFDRTGDGALRQTEGSAP